MPEEPALIAGSSFFIESSVFPTYCARDFPLNEDHIRLRIGPTSFFLCVDFARRSNEGQQADSTPALPKSRLFLITDRTLDPWTS